MLQMVKCGRIESNRLTNKRRWNGNVGRRSEGDAGKSELASLQIPNAVSEVGNVGFAVAVKIENYFVSFARQAVCSAN